MSLDLDAVAPEAVPDIRVLPVVHERVDLASVVRLVLAAADPAAVAVELPTTLADAVERAVRRLPRASVVISSEDDDDALVWAAVPGDPMVEALRWAAERGRPWFLVDPDVPYAERHRDPLPDPHVMWSLGVEAYCGLLIQLAAAAPRTEQDALRETGMAHHLLRVAESVDGPLLALVGAMHAPGVTAALGRPSAEPFARQRRSNVLLRHLHPDSLGALLPDPPLAHAAHEVLRRGEVPEDVGLDAALSRRVELVYAGLRLITGDADDRDARRRHDLARLAARRGSRIAPGGAPVPDRSALGGVVWEVAAGSYLEQTREQVQPWQRRLFLDYARRHARVQGLLVPGLYEWTVAGRGVGDDNLAWEVFDAATTYPWQEATAELETARVDGDMLDLGTRRIRFRRRFFRVKQRLMQVPVRRHPSPADPADWLRAFDGESLCSYPPEDVVIEDYGRFLQRKAVSVLSAERTRSEPFTTSLLDGVDVRETLRRWHEGRVWVREVGRAPGAAGSVVVVFDEDPGGDAFPYLMTWLGEHDQESDMAFYATAPTDQIVGPGIMRGTYGGFMLTYPPGRLFDVWQDPDYRTARTKPEVLVMAAVDYSTEKLVVHVGPSPPSPRLHQYAAVQRKRIVHLPIGSLSPVTLHRIRVVHILAGRDKRDIARDYVW